MLVLLERGCYTVGMIDAAGESKARLFTGLSLTPEIREYIAGVAREISEAVDDIRLVPPENLHVTLKFIGPCDWARVPDLLDSIRNAAAYLPLHIRIGGVGAFPSVGSARVIWVGAADREGRIDKVYGNIEKGALKCGVPEEKRRYRPHVTIGRARKRPVIVPRDLTDKFERELLLEVNDIVLFKSDLKPTGAVYSIVERVGRTDRPEGKG